MSMTSIHRQIFDLLMPVCLTTTQQMREKYEPKVIEADQEAKKANEPPKEIPELAKEILIQAKGSLNSALWIGFQLASAGFNKTQILELLQKAKIDNDRDRLMAIFEGKTEESKIFYEPFTVIVLQAKTTNNNHLYPLNTPLIVYNGKTRRLLHPNGKVDNTAYNNLYDNIRLATDEEIEQCLESLNMMQLRTILNNELYAPYIARMFSGDDGETTELVVDKGNNNPTKIILLNTQEYTFNFASSISQGQDVINRLISEGWDLSQDARNLKEGRYLKLIPIYKQCIINNYEQTPLTYEDIMDTGVIVEHEVPNQ